MGILDRFLKREKPGKERKQTEYTISSMDGENEIFAYGISRQGQIKHRNQEITDLIMARITKYRDGDAIYFDESDYIAFELPIGQEVTEEIMQAVMRQYEEESKYEDKRGYYIGRLDQIQGMYRFSNKSNSVETIVKNIVDKSERAREERIEASIREREKRETEFRKTIDVGDYEETMKRVRDERKANPTLRQQGIYEIDGKEYTDYDGINLETGDILRMRKVDKVGKDGSGTYLYSAYLDTTPNEHDVELLDRGEPAGYPVCFALQKRLEDIVKTGNINEIRMVLSLLSDRRNFETREQLSYIGETNKSGQVSRGVISSSNAINMKIQEMQQEYARKRQQKRMQEERGE